MCRWCKHYRPNEQYKGIIGWCMKHDKPTDVKSSCDDEEKGTQKWMCGKEVKE